MLFPRALRLSASRITPCTANLQQNLAHRLKCQLILGAVHSRTIKPLEKAMRNRYYFGLTVGAKVTELRRGSVNSISIGCVERNPIAGSITLRPSKSESPRASPGRGRRAPGAARRSGGPKLSAEREAAVRAALAAGTGIRRTARLVGTGNATVARIAAEMRGG
jgi:hypothetical protein